MLRLPEITPGHDLTAEDIRLAIAGLLDPLVTDDAKAEFLVRLREKGESESEIAVFVQALLEHAVQPPLPRASLPGPLIDICGTGGDGLELFNISTASMFVLAAAGACVVKHGNRAITSRCGGADVLEELGVRIDADPASLGDRLSTTGLAFLFAPLYHPAFKAIAPVRKRLAASGQSSIFNLLGPLLNPVRPDFQLVGVHSANLTRTYAGVLQKLGRARAWAIHGCGTDELTLAGASMGHEATAQTIQPLAIHPEDAGLTAAPNESLRGGDRSENAAMIHGILSNTLFGPPRDVVVLNTAAALVVCGLSPDLATAAQRASACISNGNALAKLEAMRRAC
jgi:anthranilate phosphoribosyltransferase